MEKQIVDISGKKYTRLTVVKLDHIENNVTFWLCQCECGKEKVIRKSSLIAGLTKSCGCLKRDSKGGYRFGRPPSPKNKERYNKPLT